MTDSSTIMTCGAVAGAVEALAVQPLDMIKTRFQLNAGANPTLVAAVRQLVAEGGVRRLYRGLLPEMAGNIPTRTGMYLGRDLSAPVLEQYMGGKSMRTEFLAGAFAGLPEAVATTPFQVVKCRLQNVANNSLYGNTLDCFVKVVRLEGPLALYTGFSTTVHRNAVWNGVYFSTMVVVQSQLEGQGGKLGQMQNMACGFVGGVVATCCNAPLDVLKSRVQGQTGTALQSGGTLSTLITVLREEGVRSLYKGFVPKVLRMGCGGAIGITMFELTKSVLLARDVPAVPSSAQCRDAAATPSVLSTC